MNDLDLNLFLANLDSFSRICNNWHLADRHLNYIVTGDLRIIENNNLRKYVIKRPKYREVRLIVRETVKRCILEDLDNCISS